MKFLVITLMMIVSCKAQVKEAETSDPDFALSDDGMMLTVAFDCRNWSKESGCTDKRSEREKGGYCMLLMPEDKPNDAELLNVRGGLSENQLKTSLKYMGIPDLLISGFLIELLALPFVFAGGPVTALALIPAAGGLVYRVIRGQQEGEGGGAQTIRGIGNMIWAPLTGPVFEIIARRDRFKKVVSQREIYRVSNKKMAKITNRIRDINPEFWNTCNYLKKSV